MKPTRGPGGRHLCPAGPHDLFPFSLVFCKLVLVNVHTGATSTSNFRYLWAGHLSNPTVRDGRHRNIKKSPFCLKLWSYLTIYPSMSTSELGMRQISKMPPWARQCLGSEAKTTSSEKSPALDLWQLYSSLSFLVTKIAIAAHLAITWANNRRTQLSLLGAAPSLSMPKIVY